jgi:hypothetical protein
MTGGVSRSRLGPAVYYTLTFPKGSKMKSIDKQKISKEGELAFENDIALSNNFYKRVARIVDFLLATMFNITILWLCIATIAWLFGIVAPWPISAAIIIVLLLFKLLNNK